MGAIPEESDKSPSPTRTPQQGGEKNFTKETSPKTAHDWRKYKNKEPPSTDVFAPVEVEFFDDGTVTFFW